MKNISEYRVSYWLENFDLLKKGFEYVGRDVTEDGNCLAQSKFDLINDWKLPTYGQALFLFIGLVHLYHRYAPYFEM